MEECFQENILERFCLKSKTSSDRSVVSRNRVIFTDIFFVTIYPNGQSVVFQHRPVHRRGVIMNRVGVVGATGYAGAELVRILSAHPEVEITIITSRQFAGKEFDRAYPSMTGFVNLVCEGLSTDSAV